VKQLSDWKDQVDLIVHHGKISVPYSWTVGSTLSKWYVLMRDRGEIWANRCPSCGKVYVPPKIKCNDCYKDMSDWVKLPGTGTLESYTVVHYAEPAIQPQEPPIIYGLVKLDGADTAMVHLLGEVEPEQLMSGMRVEAVLAEQREANILDIKYFRPLVGGEA
jgi:uncharacterized OB-fold protein